MYQGVVLDVLVGFDLEWTNGQLSSCKGRVTQRLTHHQRVGTGRRLALDIQQVELGLHLDTVCTTHMNIQQAEL